MLLQTHLGGHGIAAAPSASNFLLLLLTVACLGTFVLVKPRPYAFNGSLWDRLSLPLGRALSLVTWPVQRDFREKRSPFRPDAGK